MASNPFHSLARHKANHSSRSVNHSCDPNVAFDLSSSDPAEWHIRALRRIDAGQDGECATCFTVGLSRTDDELGPVYSDFLLPEHRMGA